MDELKGRIAIITGGAAGIGKAAVERFLKEGAHVVVWDINAEKGKALIDELGGLGPLHFKPVNTTNHDEVIEQCEWVIKEWGRIDILVNNAGITRDATMKKMTPEQWKQVIDVNLTGVFNCVNAVSNTMIAQNYGRIINTSSVVGLYGNFGQANYAATKSGVIGLTKSLAKELGRHSITVNAVAPGFIATEMVRAMPEKIINMMVSKTPIPRLGTPEDIAYAYTFLASDKASFISGSVLSVDGAVTI